MPSRATLKCSFFLNTLCIATLYIAMSLGCSGSAFAQENLSGKPWIDMNYGPYLSASVQTHKDNIAYKGIVIRLDAGQGGVSFGHQFVVFDTDTMRYAAAWSGKGPINWKSIVYDGSHGTHPEIVGQRIYTNPVGPGWGHPDDGRFTDERLRGHDDKPYGPLDQSWAKWRGLYIHGDQVLLSYQVGDARILDLPSLAKHNKTQAFSRTIHIGPRARNLVLQVAAPGEKQIQIRDNLVIAGLVAAQAEPQPIDKSFAFDGVTSLDITSADQLPLMRDNFSIYARIRTRQGGTILAEAPSQGDWQPDGKTFFVRKGSVGFDIGWVGAIVSRHKNVANNKWHDVAMTYNHDTGNVTLFVDGKSSGSRELKAKSNHDDFVLRLGYTSPNFPNPSGFVGDMADVRVFRGVLTAQQLTKKTIGSVNRNQLLGHWSPTSVRAGKLSDASALKHTAVVRQQTPDGSTASSHAIVAAFKDAPAGTKWLPPEQAGGDLRLEIPAGRTSVTMQILVGELDEEQAPDDFAELVQNTSTRRLTDLAKGGPARWTETVTTEVGTLGDQDGPYVVDVLTTPAKNPYRSWMRLGGFDFFADASRAAVCTWMGDVWIVDGLGGDSKRLTWKRIATGMFQPLGLKIIDEMIYVCCRDQITRLHDLNNDGTVDFYENFNNDHQVTEHFHEFAMDLQTDKAGNFYYAKSARHAKDSLVPHHGTLIRVKPDGSNSEIVCNGFRAANGVGIGPNGELATSDQEGHWTPANRVNLITEDGGFYGNMYSYHRGERPTDYERPLVWLPRNVDRSPAEQLWVASDRWGPLQGKILSLSYGTGKVFLVNYETVNGTTQGAAIRLPIATFPTGIMRGRFHPADGQLYACGLFGWSSDRTQPGGFYRIRYNGKPLHIPVDVKATQAGLDITFSHPLDPDTAGDPENYGVKRWNYRWTANYGSEHYSVDNPAKRGEDEVYVEDVSLSVDGRTVSLELEVMEPVMQMQVDYSIQAADGQEIRQVFYNTVNVLPQ